MEVISSSFPSFRHHSPVGPSSTPTISNPHGLVVLSHLAFAVRQRSEISEHWSTLYLYTKNDKYLEPIPLAFKWLENSKIGDNLWARLYEEGTNKPVYGDREDGDKVHYVYENTSERERTSYGWQGQYGIDVASQYYKDVKSLGADSYITRRDSGLTSGEQKLNASLKETEIKSIIAGIDDKGRWINKDMITCRDFVMNVNMLCEYLELSVGK